MILGLNSRQLGLWSVLALSVLATIWTSLSEDEDQGLVAVRSASAASTPAAPAASNSMQLAALTPAAGLAASDAPLDIRQLQRPRWEASAAEDDAGYDPFQGRASQAHAAEEPLQAAQQVMEIPALPFSYAGKLVDNGQYTVFLSVGEQNYSVKNGDVVLGWKVKSIQPPTMVMRYQAMQTDVPLSIGEPN